MVETQPTQPVNKSISKKNNNARKRKSQILYPVVKLKRVEAVINCPGCTQTFYNEELCTKHLLKTCIRFRSDDDEGSRLSLLVWIFDYYKSYSYGEEDPPDATQITSILKDDNIASTVKDRLRVNIPEVPECICCPVCKRCFFNTETCSEHLFRECVYSENGTDLKIQLWLSKFFSSKTENSLAVLKDLYRNYSPPGIMCKYCKIEAPNKTALMEHFESEHRESENFEVAVCVVCNFSALNEQKLVSHMILKHFRCECGHRVRNEKPDFVTLKYHVKTCPGNVKKSIKCPICWSNTPVDSELDFVKHILNCKRQCEQTLFNIPSVFGKCDICSNDIVLSDIDSHLRWHLKRGDKPSRPKRLRMSLDQWGKY